MKDSLFKLLGYKKCYFCSWGFFTHRYDTIDLQSLRPIHPKMSVAPPWAREIWIKK